ncbi:MAG: Cys-Gln thioester bond-forming surface protein, partial [Anaerotignum sp.]|nr:Cys-Gln thioester bond-forming surface protein [Anaerotignum sp.]
MKHAKKWLSLMLAFIMTTGTPLSALAAWEDGFVIPGQSGASSGYDDLFWEYTDDGLSIDSSTFESDDEEEYVEEEEETEESEDDTDVTYEEVSSPIAMFSLRPSNSATPLLADNYAEIYGTDSMPKARSATGSGPYDYLQANGGYVTVTADRPLNNILHYDGKIVDNIHIAKWVSDNPSVLEYPAYCKNPGWKGTAQHAEGKYQIDPLESIGTAEKKILGVARAGYPYKTPAELGCNSVDEAYYATHGAIHTAIVGGSLDKWSIQSGDTARNTRVLNALKKIYNEGISNPYTPPAVTVQLSPVSGSEEATIDGDWIVNTYQFDASIDRDTWKFRILGDDIMSMVENGTIEVYAGNTKLMPQTNVSGAWDTAKAFKVDMGDDVTVKVPKSLAEATGLNYTLYGTTVGGDLETAATYLGDPVGLSGNWQGYVYNFRPQGTDSAAMTYNASDTIPDTPDDEGDPDDPDTPVSSSDGSLVIEKLDYNTKKKVEDAVFHIRGVSEGNDHINIAVKATSGATEPILGRGADIQISDGVIKLTGIPEGVYEVTEVSAPPHYSVAVGQNSQSVRVEDDAEVHPKVIFENKPYGSLTIRKQDAHTQEELAGFYFKVVNHTTGFETTVETGSNGEVTIEDLPEGSYEVTEIAARFDYILDDTPQIGEVDWGEETVVVMENEKKPTIEIKKIDAETSEPIEGVHFEITHKNTQQVYMGVTDEDGMIELIDVEEGWYEVEEVTPAEGYLPSDKVYEVYAESGRPGTVTIKNTLRS